MIPTRDAPPRESFETFARAQIARNAAMARGPKGELKGVNRLFNGQTQSGKTTLNRILLRLKRNVIVFGTKPGVDTSLDEYVEKEGYVRIDHWPPTRKELRQRGTEKAVRLLLWPEVKKYEDLRRHAATFRACLRQVAIEGRWTVGIDEGLWVCSPKGLNLGQEVSDLAYGGASNGVSLHILVQRPRQIPPIIYSSCHEGYLFKAGNENDMRELASYTSYAPRDVATAIRSLNKANPERGHEFLYAPLSGGSSWMVSEVPANRT